MEKSSLLLTQCTRNYEFAIGGKPLASFYRVNATLVIGGIKREKENTFIT
jgi:hypothetical protein